ncbi:unnamed protein product [Prorocentrum cordatum]|uniref:Protein-serine/threonine kinase n=1 Tax=Prorocentrum cordatum TaxID=2364126 RepID=A0ABN9VLD5_9DINO|nr:unnamed protein product [Polarella glacialis]
MEVRLLRIRGVPPETGETAAGVMDGGHGSQSQTELSGYGVGLPLSRLYARHLGGDIVISQVLGHGTEASVFLSRHGIREDFCLGDSEEPAAETHGALRGRDSMRAPF